MWPRIPTFHACLWTTRGASDVNFLLYVAARSHKCQGWRVGPYRRGARPSRADTRKLLHLMIGAPRRAAPPASTSQRRQTHLFLSSTPFQDAACHPSLVKG